MRTVLFATTALVASAGIAAADVTLSGSAEMGIFGGETSSGEDIDPQFHTDIDVTFTMTGETDTGLVFGADVDLDESIGDNNDDGCTIDVPGIPDATCTAGESKATRDDSQHGGAVIFVSGAFGTLTMGDTDGAFDWALQEAIIGSSLRDDHEHFGYDGNAGLDGTYDGQIARYEYAFQDFAVAVSAELDDATDGADPVLGLGVRYATEFAGAGVAFGAGVQTIGGLDDIVDRAQDKFDFDEDTEVPDNITIWGLSADVDLDSGIRFIANYSDLDEIGDHWGVAVGYSFDAFTVAANYGEFSGGNEADDGDGYGLIANYDLGGGAELQAGYGHNSPDGGQDYDTYSLGISMSF